MAKTIIKLREKSRSLPLLIGASITSFTLLVGIISIFWLPYDVNAMNPAFRLLPFGTSGHLFGTDYLGRDVMSMLMAGARTSLIIGFCAALLAMTLGFLYGTIAASFKVLDEPIMRTADIFMAMPGIIFALVLAATIGSGYATTIFALTTFFTPAFIRVTRASTMRVLAEDYVSVAKLYGRNKMFIIFRHVLPNISSILIVQFTVYFAAGVLTEAGLSYLGVGISRPSVSLGMLLKEAQDQVGTTSILGLWSGLSIVIIVIGLNLLGDGLRDRFDPRLAKR
jgi:peptide/nickel transport system permease protein